MHLAAAFGIPQVVLYGPTNPYHWRPRHSASRVVMAGRDEPLRELADFEKRAAKEAMTRIEVAHVMAAIEELPARKWRLQIAGDPLTVIDGRVGGSVGGCRGVGASALGLLVGI